MLCRQVLMNLIFILLKEFYVIRNLLTIFWSAYDPLEYVVAIVLAHFSPYHGNFPCCVALPVVTISAMMPWWRKHHRKIYDSISKINNVQKVNNILILPFNELVCEILTYRQSINTRCVSITVTIVTFRTAVSSCPHIYHTISVSSLKHKYI